jgi:hypothetical protein
MRHGTFYKGSLWLRSLKEQQLLLSRVAGGVSKTTKHKKHILYENLFEV